MELQVIILSCITMGVIQFIKDEKEKTDKNMRVKKVLNARTNLNNRKYKTTYKDIKYYFKVLNKAVFKNLLTTI